MTLRPPFPSNSGAATFQDIRLALAGLVARDSTGKIRTGVLPYTTADLVTKGTGWNVAIAAHVLAVDRNGLVLLPNDGTINVTISSAPSSGSRWSIIYEKQREMESPFSDTAWGPIADKVESTSSETAARTALALIPGAVELAVVKVDAGAASIVAASGVTLTQTSKYTAAEGGVVLVRNATELAAWTPADGATAYRIDEQRAYVRRSGAWVRELVIKGFQLTGSTDANGILTATNPFAGITPSWVQVTMQSTGNETLAKILSPIVWTTPLTTGNVGIRFRRTDINDWATSQPVACFVTFGLEP
jgi:hypothetical protein